KYFAEDIVAPSRSGIWSRTACGVDYIEWPDSASPAMLTVGPACRAGLDSVSVLQVANRLAGPCGSDGLQGVTVVGQAGLGAARQAAPTPSAACAGRAIRCGRCLLCRYADRYARRSNRVGLATD